jgi:hypothetical protein
MTEKLAWAAGIGVFVAAIRLAPAAAPVDTGTWMAGLLYLIGLHWIVAYLFGGTMYGALRLQPSNRVGRTVVLGLGLVAVFIALQYVLGFGGPLAAERV